MEPVDEGQDFLAIVDFAHTPNALRNALVAARTMTGPGGRVIVVFGCAGMRDRGKRPLMGRVAGELADVTVVTAEDPRTEDLADIMRHVETGLNQSGAREGESYALVADRFRAIRRARDMAGSGDVLVVAGKGHEQSMCFGDVEYPWDDRNALRAALRGQPYGDLPTAS
jgi:UDP-N-acetylmuramoyl-L-alanyl-D-glutamate--2,6-diaminopimelate ligase